MPYSNARRTMWGGLCLIVVFLVALPSPAQRAARLSWWDRAAAGNAGAYWLKTDLPLDDARPLADHLNAMYRRYSERLASLPSRTPEKLNVLIFADRDDYELTLRARFGVNATGTGGMFFSSPSGGGLAVWTGSLPTRRVHHVLQHEGFHQFADSRFRGDLPIWVNEGLAEFFGNAVIVGEKLVIGQAQPRDIRLITEAIENEGHIPFVRMLSMTHDDWNEALRQGRARLQYTQAWSMIDFLVYGDDGRYVEAFERYLKLLNNALPSREAFSRAFGVTSDVDVDDFESRWKTYALQLRPRGFTTALERIEFLAEGAIELNRRGVNPRSLAEFREALQRIEFTHTLEGHGLDVTLDARDDELFRIPSDGEGIPAPVFEVTPIDTRRATRRERHREEMAPSPPTIRTAALRPHELHVVWRRDKNDERVFRYEIEVR